MKTKGRLIFIAAVTICIFSSTAHAQSATPHAETLHRPATPGFILGYKADNGQMALEEWVPAGETVENWSRMVTFQRLGGLRTLGHTPFSFGDVLASRLISSCPGATTSSINIPAPDGVSIAELSAYCPLISSTGKPEMTFFKFIAGERDILVAQVAFRRNANSGDRKWAEAYLNSVQLCSHERSDCIAIAAAQ